ncbi:hypothetical protein CsSME_00026544 [Camellia sinensis var. sinensis]|uniref:Uncharacterized protein n=1 Tax=Camellia sinensis TaxID=4442 RepID=A0A7J7H6K0_CAMSI|nr:uncharacterized protein LOC114302097 isoform X1 [Camellia sinensis]XP_028102869.1 uncharacterized protein LOC114302097 isoform X2 [Camellia sinensis]KAF5948613.1 hypothetical protein HYC85_014570 [Camellia sinensis]
MSVERSFEAWEEVQRHGQDLADRLAQGFTGLIHSHITPPSFPWPNTQKPNLIDTEFPTQRDFGLAIDNSGINGVSAILDIGNRLGQAGADFGASLNGMVEQLFRRLPVPFRQDENVVASLRTELNNQMTDVGGITMQEDLGSLAERFRDFGFAENEMSFAGSMDEELSKFNSKTTGLFGRPQGTINVTSTYDSRTHDVEGSLVARGDWWRVEASQGSSTAGNENSSLFLVQLGPVLFVRDSTLLLPVHLSKQHLLWYGYDRKNGMHSLCPAVWSKHRRWLLMSMICLNPLACSFMDLQFPNGQFTYVSGEGLSTSAFLPFCGGLLQAQGRYPGEMRFSFSCKNKWGTRITPTVQWPDKSFTLGLAQALAWKRSGLMVRPTIQFSVCPTYGGSNPGLQAELIHSVNEELNLICGCAFMAHPSAFASLSLGRSKWNGNVGSSGIVVRVETPLSNVGGPGPSFSVQLNSGIEF